jgi:hypothetical protein
LNTKVSRISHWILRVKGRVREKAKVPKAIIDGDNNNALSAELYAVKEGIKTRVEIETTTVHPNHDGKTICVALSRRPDI